MRELPITDQIKSSIVEGKPVFVMVTAQNCPSCVAAKPVFETTSQVFESTADFYQVDIQDLDPLWARSRQLRAAPTLLMFRFGVEEHRLSTAEGFARQGIEIASFIDAFVSQNEGGASQEFECEACQ